MQLDAQKLGLQMEDMQRIWKEREARSMRAARQQYARELVDAKRLALDTKRIEQQAQQQTQQSTQ
jgi:hypothetical protein